MRSPWTSVKRLCKKVAWETLGYAKFTQLLFLYNHGYWPNLKLPTTFSEKIQWIKIYGELERYAHLVDKFEVRNFVRDTIGEEFLVPLFGVYESADDIDFQLLPDSFVVKATHGSGMNIIVQDKSLLDLTTTKARLNRWIRSSYYEHGGESQYKPLSGRIIIEQLLHDDSGDVRDYKFFCFSGEPKFVQVDATRFTHHRRDVYDITWIRLPLRLGGHDNLLEPAPRPLDLQKMLDICRVLSTGIPFVRVDLYYCNRQIYFGELTFTPGNGMERFAPERYDRMFGDFLDVNLYRQ